MQGPGAFPGLSDVTLALGAISSEAALTAENVPSSTRTGQANPRNCLDYSRASGTFSFTSTDLAGIPTAVSNALADFLKLTANVQSQPTPGVYEVTAAVLRMRRSGSTEGALNPRR